MSADTLYDSNSYLLADRGTPPLEKSRINYETEETPPPLASTRETSLAPSSGDEGGAGGRSSRPGKNKSTLGEVVLLNTLEPNRPDIAKGTGRHAPGSESDAEEADITLGRGRGTMTATTLHYAVPTSGVNVSRGDTLLLKQDTFDEEEFVNIDVEEGKTKQSEQSRSLNNGEDNPISVSRKSPAEIRSPQKDYNLRPPPLRPTSSYHKLESESLSPGLTRFMADGRDADPDARLMPIQRSPSTSRHNPLPSLQTLVDSPGGPLSTHSPNMMRSANANGIYNYASPFSASAMSPPATSDPSAYRSNTSGSVSTPSEYAISSASTLTSISTPSSAPVHSPHHFPTPISTSNVDHPMSNAALPPPHDLADPINRHTISPEDDFQNGSFKCTVKNCTAASFQTQYLLNSHMNVHSDERPHFCSVPSCPRSVGGQGFKRKNEMIRHGLVHTSPGYTCPFCPDQQHKYPRPDNLQRHVRVHHPDRDRDDPELRDVLAQRPEGGSRGRRRRLGS